MTHATTPTAPYDSRTYAMTVTDDYATAIHPDELVADLGPWPHPVDHVAATHGPELPTEHLCGLQSFVEAAAESRQVPPDLVAMYSLGAISTGIGGRRYVELDDGWTEELAFYGQTLLPSGERKSAVRKLAKAPLGDAEKTLREEDGHRREQLRRELHYATRDLKAAEKDGGDTYELQKRVEELKAELSRPTPQLLADDVTPEALTVRMAGQGGRMGILTDEAHLWGMMSGRYNTSPNLQIFLNGHVGEDVRTARLSRDDVEIDRPVLSLVMACQPGVVEGLATRSSDLKHNGLLARFAYAVPRSRVGHRKIAPGGIPSAVQQDYHRRLYEIAVRVWPSDRRPVTLSSDALALVRVVQDETEKALGEGGDLAGDRADWGGKLVGLVVRIAALLAIYDNPDTSTVGADHMDHAMSLVPYLKAHAEVAFRLMGRTVDDTQYQRAREVRDWLADRNLTRFKVAQVSRGLGGRAWVQEGKTRAVREAIYTLASEDWVREVPQIQDENRRGRRRDSLWVLHPCAVACACQQ